MGRHFPKPPKKKPKPDPQLQAHEAALLRQQQEQQRKDEEQRIGTLQPGEYPKGNVAHTRGWEPGNPLDVPHTKILVDGIEQQQPKPFDGVFQDIDPQSETLGKRLGDAPRESAVERERLVKQSKDRAKAGDKAVPNRSALTNSEKVGFLVAFGSVAAGFVVGALAAAGIINMGLAQIMLLAALIVMTAGTFIVEHLSGRSGKRIAVSTFVTALLSGLILFGVISPWMIRKKAQQDATTVQQQKLKIDEAPKVAQSQEEDLRGALRADGNRAIRLVTIRVALKRKYSVDEIGHFRVMYEVASVTDKITPEFYLANQDYYDVNTTVDPATKQFGYRWTVRYREPNNTYVPTAGFSKGRGYGATTGLVPSTDVIDFSVDISTMLMAEANNLEVTTPGNQHHQSMRGTNLSRRSASH